MEKQRPNPEQLLLRVQEEERQQKRGKLKIYFGAAPGVGKTYTMLQDAIAKREQGLDVVIGVVESHGRGEIEQMLKGFEILPRQKIEYRNKQFLEFDLDGALKRKPSLILIDEMAHTNASGLRHVKRWQDIKEILDRGIDVYTTLNVQHLESLNDIVAQIIGIRVKETMPDSMLELANTIEIVDLPPEDLLKRIQEGKVYIPKQADLAIEHFFTKENLTALRELALRVTAERVEAQVLLYRQGQGIERIWPTKERILVCVGPNPESMKVIRAARRMATSLQAEWVAVYVEIPRIQTSVTQRSKAIQNLRFAEQLGAETHILTGLDIVKEIISFARERNVTKIVIGKNIRPRWQTLLFSSLTDELLRHSGEIDVYIITGEPEKIKLPKIIPIKRQKSWSDYGVAIGVVAFATFINILLFARFGLSNIVMIYLLGVITVAMRGNLKPSLLASILSVLAYDFFFLPPRFSFTLEDPSYLITMAMMLLVAYLISHLTILTRRQAEVAHHAERRTLALNVLSRQLASTRGIDKLLEIAVRYLGEFFDSEVMALLPENNHLTIRAKYRTENPLSDKEQSVAQWVFGLGQPAGMGTDTLPSTDTIYVPLLASQGPVGVLKVRPREPDRLLIPEQMRFLEACAHQVAIALEVDRLQEEAKQSELQIETDRVRSVLLHSVSYDLRTPLVAIMSSASTLSEMGGDLDDRTLKKMGNDIYVKSEQLSRLINNLLQMTYLEAESVKLQKEMCLLTEVITDLLKTLTKQLEKNPVHLHIADDLPKIPVDRTLIDEVFINLLDNAIKFAAPKTPIDISVTAEKDQVVIRIGDRGPGFTADEANRLFDKFYQGHRLATEQGLGLGLGLAICRSIIKAHGGKIWAENRPGGGAIFCFTLPNLET